MAEPALLDVDVSTPRIDRRTRRVPAALALAFVAFSALTVYATAVSLHTIDVDTGLVAAAESLKQYQAALSGTRAFPYQWRLLGVYIVRAGERLTGARPHAVDLVVKTALLALSSTLLFVFARAYSSGIASIAVVGLYLLLTAVAFIDETYAIYFTNDYAMLVCWFAAVYLIREERFAAAAVVTFAGAWARETMVLVPMLMALRCLRSRSAAVGFASTLAAFAIPTIVLRRLYPAPLGAWAWWHMLFVNVPFLQSDLHQLAMTLRYNLKVALFFNVFWAAAAVHVFRTTDTFLKDVAAVCVVYLLMAYPVVFIRELRHFLPLAILVLPAAVSELQRRHADLRS